MWCLWKQQYILQGYLILCIETNVVVKQYQDFMSTYVNTSNFLIRFLYSSVILEDFFIKTDIRRILGHLFVTKPCSSWVFLMLNAISYFSLLWFLCIKYSLYNTIFYLFLFYSVCLFIYVFWSNMSLWMDFMLFIALYSSYIRRSIKYFICLLIS